jgi:hypothetical protein
MESMMRLEPCEIIYEKKAKGWRWRSLPGPGAAKTRMSEGTFQLFYECVLAARACGYNPPIKCR